MRQREKAKVTFDIDDSLYHLIEFTSEGVIIRDTFEKECELTPKQRNEIVEKVRSDVLKFFNTWRFALSLRNKEESEFSEWFRDASER